MFFSFSSFWFSLSSFSYSHRLKVHHVFGWFRSNDVVEINHNIYTHMWHTFTHSTQKLALARQFWWFFLLLLQIRTQIHYSFFFLTIHQQWLRDIYLFNRFRKKHIHIMYCIRSGSIIQFWIFEVQVQNKQCKCSWINI